MYCTYSINIELVLLVSTEQSNECNKNTYNDLYYIQVVLGHSWKVSIIASHPRREPAD